jgi:putative membrane protein
MTDAAKETHRFEVRMTSDSHFSWLRTRLAVERTLLSWVRTAVSLIGFGFTIVQFFERFASMQGIEPAARPEAPRYLGLALIGAGILALAVSLWQYRHILTYLWSGDFTVLAGEKGTATQTPAYLVAIVMILIGLFAFVAVLTRWV